MRPNFRFPLLAAGLVAALAGCRHTEVVVPGYDNYYPVAVGDARVYAAVDTTWTNGVVSVSQYQVRERVGEQYTDAAGLTAYRVLHARRADATAAWVDDSVWVLQPLPRLVLLTRSNQRTVELVYPAVAAKTWNRDAFTVDRQAATYYYADTITNQTRRYGSVGGAYTAPAIGGQAAVTYAATATVADILPATVNDGLYRRSGRQQVFAKDTGPVLRRTYYYELFKPGAGGIQVLTSTPYNGRSHREQLLN